jgi:hypothetical protein
MIIFFIALILLNIFYYEYRVIKGLHKYPKDVTEAYGKLSVRKRYHEKKNL